jgi:hypothetical protein
MANKRIAGGISKVINKLHGIDNPEPLQEGKGYTTGNGEEIKKTPRQKEIVKKKVNEHVIWGLLQEGKYKEASKLVDGDWNLMSPDQKEIMVEWRKLEQEQALQISRQKILKEQGVTEEDSQRGMILRAQRAQLEQMGKNFASGSGPITSNILSGTSKPNTTKKESQSLFDALNSFAPSESKKEIQPNKQKDTEHTKVTPGRIERLRKGDSEADVLAKMFNFMKKQEDWQKKKEIDDKKYRTKMNNQKDNFTNEIVEALGGKRPTAGRRSSSFLTKKMAAGTRKSGFLKYGLQAAVGIGGFLVAKDALANINWSKKFDDTFKDFKFPEFELKKSITSPNVSEIPAGNTALKDLVKQGESKSAGEYNAYNKGKAGDSLGSKKLNLTEMKLNDIMQMQSEKKIFAVGAYQIIPKTLQGIKKQMNLTGEETFNESLQDKMFNHLAMQKKSYREYMKTGDESLLKDAASELSGIWAAFKDPYTGKGRYDDRGNNKASIEGTTVMSAIKKSREQMVAGQNPTERNTSGQNTSSSNKKGTVTVGDSIAFGFATQTQTGKSSKKEATGGLGSADILNDIRTKRTDLNPNAAAETARRGTKFPYINEGDVTNAETAILSVGSNDYLEPRLSQLPSNLEAIRKELGAKKYIWILPANTPMMQGARAVVEKFAKSKGDKTVDFTASGDKVHPANYAEIEKQVNEILKPSVTILPAEKITGSLQKDNYNYNNSGSNGVIVSNTNIIQGPTIYQVSEEYVSTYSPATQKLYGYA